MRAAAGLKVHALDLQHAHPPQATRGLHAHAAHEAGVGVEFVLADPAVAYRVRLGHQAGEAGVQRVLVQRLAHVEVQPGMAGGDGAAIHRMRHQGAQQVRGGVKAHVRATALGVDAGRDAHAWRKS